MLLSILTVIAILSCRKTGLMVAVVLVCLLLCHQKKAWKTKPRLHLHGPPQVYPSICPWQGCHYCSHCPTWQRTNRPLILLCAFHHKKTNLLFTTRISLLILNKSQPHVNPPMWCSHPCLCSLAWKCRKWSVPRGMEITNIEVTYLEVCLSRVHAATAHPKRIQWLCCAFEGHSKQGENLTWMWRVEKTSLGGYVML